MFRRPLALAALAVFQISAAAHAAPAVSVKKTDDSVIVSSETWATRIQVCSERTIRVTHSPSARMPDITSLSIIKKWGPPGFRVMEKPERIDVLLPKITALIDRATGAVTFTEGADAVLLREQPNSSAFTPASVGGEKTFNIEQKFGIAKDEAFYGLGCMQLSKLDYCGEKFKLFQDNTVDITPVLLSSKGYGILWDNPSTGEIDIAKDQPDLIWRSDCGDAIDYYFIYGPDFDRIISSYRDATGKAPMFGKWAYGFWQCKEHYDTQQELIDISKEFRARKIPIDNIVQDWYYWNPKPWGSHEFDPERYPDMAAAIKTLRDTYNMHVMISVWPKFEAGSKNYDELTSIGGLFLATRSSAAYYDAFSPKAREVYWRQMKDQLFSKGIDAWWLDATEPEYTWPIRPDLAREFKTAMGPGAKVWSAYPLMTTKAIYEGQRAATSDKRVYILTRSCWAGIQRNAAVVWSGDIRGRWSVYKDQVASGLNFCMTGIPYWATDIGGFESGNPEDPGYRELFLRWFEWGSFCPIFRVHGTRYPKEMWRFGEDAEKIQLKFDNLRYRLLPYIYSTAWMVTDQGYTMMRALPMDFRTDPKVLNISDQFMFGPALLINPVMEAGATSRCLYLPSGTDWYDFWTGERTPGGKTVDTPAPIESMPIYVRAGSIIPMGPFVQYSTEKPADPIELRIYQGASGKFTIYEDENDNYNYEKGKYATITVAWDEKKQTLTIGKRSGSFLGMLKERNFRAVFVGPAHGVGLDTASDRDRLVRYTGAAVSVKP